jgi:hypothetical protein
MNDFKELEQELRKELADTGSVVRDGDMTHYRTIQHEGYLGDFATEWWTEEDWNKHNKYVEELKAKGTYGKPWICELVLKDNPEYDRPHHPISGKPMESYRIEFIDFSDGRK